MLHVSFFATMGLHLSNYLVVVLQGVCWMLTFAFTLLLAYQTDAPRRLQHSLDPDRDAEADNDFVRFPLSWWLVASPLLALQFVLGSALIVVLYNEFAGVYRLTRWQLAASALYSLALVSGVTGELMLLGHADYHWGTFTFPSALVLLGLVCASVAIYIVGRYYVDELMATKGGAVPVPLTRTTDGWITGHAVIEQWVLFGDVHLTPEGLERRNRLIARRNSAADSDNGGSSAPGSRLVRWCQRVCRRVGHGDEDPSLGERDPERRIRNLLRRKTSGSYSDLTLEVVDTPKER